MSKQLFKEKAPSLKEVCQKCNCVLGRAGTMTGWIFKENRCQCSVADRMPSLVVVGSSDKNTNGGIEVSTEQTSRTFEPGNVNLGPDYEVLSLLGQGGMGTVYKVRSRSLGKVFAAKVLSPELTKDALSVRRFEQEAEAAMALSHPNIAAIYSHNISPDKTHFLIMEYVEGIGLDRLLAQQKLGQEFATDLFIQICEALEHAHAHGIIHRDLKPANIIIAENAQGVSIVKIVDFGIAKVAATAKRQTLDLTQTGELFGSPSYMSPEQCLGFECDARSDLYSLGCIMYETVSGRAPFAEPNVIQTIIRHLDTPPKPLSPSVFLRAPESLNNTILRALEKDPVARYQSAGELKKDLELVQAGKKTKTRKRNSSRLPQKVVAIVLLNIMLMFGAFNQYSDAVAEQSIARDVVSLSNSVTQMLYDAGVSVGLYSVTKSPQFADRYNKIVQQIPETLKLIETDIDGDAAAMESIGRVKEIANKGIDVLSKEKTIVDRGSPNKDKAKVRHTFAVVRQLADKLRDELVNMMKRYRSISEDKDWMLRANAIFGLEMMLLFAANFLSLWSLWRSKEKKDRSLLWIGYDKKLGD